MMVLISFNSFYWEHLTKISNEQTQEIMNRIKYFVTIFSESCAGNKSLSEFWIKVNYSDFDFTIMNRSS